MKLEYVKERIDNYFDNISPEELYKTLIKYNMCLISKQRFPNILTHEMETYKIIICHQDCDYWEAVFTHTYHKYGKLLKINRLETIDSFTDYSGNFLYKIDKGYFHSFINNFTANLVKENLISKGYDKNLIRVVKVKIPKGSLYYKSFDNIEICSSQIFINKDLFNYRD